MTMLDDRTVFEKLMGRPLPDYYDTMYLDSYKPWEIVEAAHNSIIKEAKDVTDLINKYLDDPQYNEVKKDEQN